MHFDYMLTICGQMSVDLPVAVLGPSFHGNHHHVSRSFFTVTSPLPDAGPLAAPLPPPDAVAAPGPVPVPDAAVDVAPAPDAPVPSMVETSPCMNAHGGLLGELSNGQRSPLGQYTSPSPRRFWMYTLVQGKQNLHLMEERIGCYNFQRMIRDTDNYQHTRLCE